MPQFFICDDFLAVAINAIAADEHIHHALQITLGLEGQVEAVGGDTAITGRCVLIQSDCSHRMASGPALTYLIQPEAGIAQALRAGALRHQNVVAFDVKPTCGAGEALTCNNIYAQFAAIVGQVAGDRRASTDLDPRIAQALDYIDEQPFKKISAEALAKSVFLSPSRLGHLFKDNVGIPLRRYLLWHRLLVAAQLIVEGADFTTAAHDAGFADSAHFSRTFRRMIGMSPSDVFQDSQFIQVSLCPSS